MLDWPGRRVTAIRPRGDPPAGSLSCQEPEERPYGGTATGRRASIGAHASPPLRENMGADIARSWLGVGSTPSRLSKQLRESKSTVRSIVLDASPATSSTAAGLGDSGGESYWAGRSGGTLTSGNGIGSPFCPGCRDSIC